MKMANSPTNDPMMLSRNPSAKSWKPMNGSNQVEVRADDSHARSS